MQIGVCMAPEDLTRAVEGLNFIETTVAGLLCPREDDAAFASRLEAMRAAPLPTVAVNCLLPGDLKTTGPEVNAHAVDAYFTTVCRRAAKAGVEVIVFGSGGSRGVPEGFDHAAAGDQIVEHLTRWGPIAADAGVTLVVEPLNRTECNIVNTVGEGAELVRRADHPHIRLLADTYHMALDGDSPDAIRAAGDLIVHVHCAEADGRGPIGAKGEDHRPYFRALKDIAYDGRVSIEANWDNLQAQLPEAIARLREQIDTA